MQCHHPHHQWRTQEFSKDQGITLRGAVTGCTGATTLVTGAPQLAEGAPLPTGERGRRHRLDGAIFYGESPYEVPDDYHMLDTVCDGPNRPFILMLTIAIFICMMFFLLAAPHRRPESKWTGHALNVRMLGTPLLTAVHTYMYGYDTVHHVQYVTTPLMSFGSCLQIARSIDSNPHIGTGKVTLTNLDPGNCE